MSEIVLRDLSGDGRSLDAVVDGVVVGHVGWVKPRRWGFQVEGRPTRYVRRRRSATRGLIAAIRRQIRDRGGDAS